jgi:competence protein ComEC
MQSKSLIFIYSSIFFLIAVFVNNITKEIYTSLLALLTLGVFFLLYYVLYKKYGILLIASIIWFIIWILISTINFLEIKHNDNILNNYYNKNSEIILKIDNTYKISEYNKEYLAILQKIWWKTVERKIKVLIKVPKNYNIKKGYIIKTKWKIKQFEDFNDFSYKKYMLSKNIYFYINIYKFDITNIEENNFLDKKILWLRELSINTINSIYPTEEAIFLWWILLWARESLSKELKQDFNNSWLTHFIAVSGFNITILIVFISYILQYFPIFFRILFITGFIGIFTILVGDTAPVIRASIMGLVWYYILMSWRKWNSLAIILFTLIVMIILSPLSLNYDVSLHLSFLAVLWIIYTQKFFEKTFDFLPNFLEIKTAFTLTLSAMVFTLPIIFLNFGQMSILSPFANIAVTWTIPIAMLFGFISILVYFVYSSFWIIIWYIAWIFLKWDILVVHFFWKQDWALLKFDLWIYKYHLEILYFIILIFLIIYFRKKEEQT